MPTTPDAMLEVLGVSVRDGTPTIDVDLRLTRGLHAMYGRNGVGKTQVLRRVATTLAGVGTGGAVVARVATFTPVADGPDAPEDPVDPVTRRADAADAADATDPADPDAWAAALIGLRPYPNSAFVTEIRHVLRTEADLLGRVVVATDRGADDDTDPGSPAGLGSLERLVADVVRGVLRLAAAPPGTSLSDAHVTTIARIADEVARQGLFHLEAVGTTEPAFTVSIAASPDDSAPVFRRALEEVTRAWATLNAATAALEEQGGDTTAGEAAAWRAFQDAVADNPLAYLVQDHLDPDEVHHAWVPFPLVHGIGTVRRPLDGVTVIGPDPIDLDQWTRAAVRAHLEDHREPGDVFVDPDEDPATAATPDADAIARLGLGAIVDRARAVADRLLEDPPRLQAASPTPLEFLLQPPALWTADDPYGARVPITALSHAQRRLVGLAVAVATETAVSPCAGQLIVLIDEPELGLHRRAERRLTDALATLADDLGATVVCATHSPALLGEPRTTLHHVTRTDGGTIVARAMPSDAGRAVEALGCTPADLFQIVRRVVVVDDPVDAAVLRHLDHGVVTDRPELVTPVRPGPDGAATLGIAAIWDLTEARVVAVLSEAAYARVGARWESIVAAPLRTDDDRTRVVAGLRALTVADGDAGSGVAPGVSAEVEWFVDLAARAVRDGRTDRVCCVGLAGPSVVARLGIVDDDPTSARAVLAAVATLDRVPDDVARVLAAGR
jgi:ABC-type transport system involved in cytochrome c biogenesis ATPase subunit